MCVCFSIILPSARRPEESPSNYYKGFCGLPSTQLILRETSKRGTPKGGREGGGEEREVIKRKKNQELGGIQKGGITWVT